MKLNKEKYVYISKVFYVLLDWVETNKRKKCYNYRLFFDEVMFCFCKNIWSTYKERTEERGEPQEPKLG
jgi:hypothetical protein